MPSARCRVRNWLTRAPWGRMCCRSTRTLDEVAASVQRLAERLDAVAEGDRIAARMNSSIEETAEAVRDRVPRRVFFAEWLDPPFSAGHWVPEMVALAGGRDVIGVAATPSRSVTGRGDGGSIPSWSSLARADLVRRKPPDELQVSSFPARLWWSTATATSRDRLRGWLTASGSLRTLFHPDAVR